MGMPAAWTTGPTSSACADQSGPMMPTAPSAINFLTLATLFCELFSSSSASRTKSFPLMPPAALNSLTANLAPFRVVPGSGDE